MTSIVAEAWDSKYDVYPIQGVKKLKESPNTWVASNDIDDLALPPDEFIYFPTNARVGGELPPKLLTELETLFPSPLPGTLTRIHGRPVHQPYSDGLFRGGWRCEYHILDIPKIARIRDVDTYKLTRETISDIESAVSEAGPVLLYSTVEIQAIRSREAYSDSNLFIERYELNGEFCYLYKASLDAEVAEKRRVARRKRAEFAERRKEARDKQQSLDREAMRLGYEAAKAYRQWVAAMQQRVVGRIKEKFGIHSNMFLSWDRQGAAPSKWDINNCGPNVEIASQAAADHRKLFGKTAYREMTEFKRFLDAYAAVPGEYRGRAFLDLTPVIEDLDLDREIKSLRRRRKLVARIVAKSESSPTD